VDAITLGGCAGNMRKKYIRPDNAHIIVVGKGSDIADKLTKFGEVKHFDIYGEGYVPAKASALPAGPNRGKGYFKLYRSNWRGTKKIQELKSVKTVMKATIQGTELTMTVSKKAPGKSVTEVSVQGNVMQKSVTDGKDVAEIQMGQKAPVDPAAKEKSLFEAHLVPEAMVASAKVKATLKAIETVDGKEAYVVDYEFSGW
jgi:zinc protease